MSQRLFLVITTLLLLTGLLWQRSSHTYYAYTKSELEKERIYLNKQMKVLEMEIQQKATPAELYSYWKEHEDELAFIEKANEIKAKELIAEQEKKEKAAKSKTHMASLKGGRSY